jgi:fatty-acid desaturase
MAPAASALDRWFRRVSGLDAASPIRVDRRVLGVVAGIHLMALLACIPYLFTWSGLAVAILGVYLFGTLGINICFHRLLVHRGFSCPLWLEHALALLGVCSLQGTPIGWVAIHRMHHQKSDEAGDPHTPRDGFFWSHVGWVLAYDPAIHDIATYDRYARDMISQRYYKSFERPRVWQKVQLIHASVFLIGGALFGGVVGGLAGGTFFDFASALRVGMSWLVWGVLVRTVVVWHVTWSVNSLSHVWGYRNYETKDDSRNNWLVGLIGMGEGWHNNHHSDPRSVKNGHRWWELDVSYLTVRVLAMFGLAWNLVLPRRMHAHGATVEAPVESQEPRHAA